MKDVQSNHFIAIIFGLIALTTIPFLISGIINAAWSDVVLYGLGAITSIGAAMYFLSSA